MQSHEIRQKFIDYFVNTLKAQNMGHTQVESSPLIPENHPTLLFTNSGMVQFTPYFLGEKDPIKDFGNTRLVSCQKCIRTGDLDIVGRSKYHQTFFEMLGNWSIGDYGKKEAVKFSYDLLVNGFGLDPNKFYPTVFAGNNEAPEDRETIEAWKEVGIPENRIPKLPASENWWAPGPVGPCGPCTEVLYDRGEEFGEYEETPGLTDNPRYLEIWNAGVFMQFNRKKDGSLEPLPKLSVDTGSGLERLCVVIQNVNSNYQTDLFTPIIAVITNEKITDSKLDLKTAFEKEEDKRSLSEKEQVFAIQKVADHLKTVTFLIAEGLNPGGKDQSYVLRKLIREIFNKCVWTLDIDSKYITQLVDPVIEIYKNIYPELNNVEKIKAVLIEEIELYAKTAEEVRKLVIKNRDNSEFLNRPYDIRQSHGAPRELLEIISKEQGVEFNFNTWQKDEEAHQELSRTNMAGRFKGGLGDNSEITTKYHTATHLIHKALRQVLGDTVGQMGSNITAERLRFDFSHPQKVTDEEIKKVEEIVNSVIEQGLPVNKIVLPKEEALKTGALHFFKEKYGDEVSIYFVGENLETAFSKEFCGGPHVTNTKEIGKIKIVKEEAVAKGIRRIKAVLV